MELVDHVAQHLRSHPLDADDMSVGRDRGGKEDTARSVATIAILRISNDELLLQSLTRSLVTDETNLVRVR